MIEIQFILRYSDYVYEYFSSIVNIYFLVFKILIFFILNIIKINNMIIHAKYFNKLY